MNSNIHRWALVPILVTALLAGLILWLGRVSAVSSTAEAIDRDHEPVLVTGADLVALQGAPTDELFVYAYRDDADVLEQIPFQVDVKDAGTYVPDIGTPLDDDDEVVFMASDLGDEAPDYELTANLPISDTWYRLEVTDPQDSGARGWAYVVRSATLTQSFTETYASFEPVTERITTNRYALGFLQDHPGFDYLALNGSGEDILDRTKLRLYAFGLPVGNEEDLDAPDPAPVKNGPVRVIVPGRGVIGYQAMFHIWIDEELPLGVTAARLSTDFSADVVPATFYDANTTAGVPIDGAPDEVPETPLSDWRQISSDSGSLVQVADASGSEGTLTNYYKDDNTPDSDDTGDQVSYGDTGTRVDGLGDAVVYLTWLYVLPESQPNVGERYAGYIAEPLEVTAVQGQNCPVSVQDVSISGPDAGYPDVDYAFTASVDPSDATEPIEYAWSSDGLVAGAGTASVTYRWATTGTHVISLTVQNCGGAASASDTHPVVLSAPPSCEQPLTGVSVSGPSSGSTDETLTFTASPEPSSFTPPITYTWSSDGFVGNEDDKASYRWADAGDKEVQVTARNCGGQDHSDILYVQIREHVYLPLVLKQ